MSLLIKDSKAKHLLFFFVAFVFCFETKATEIVFSGTPVSAVNIEESCQDFIKADEICLDEAFQLKYKVKELFVGKAENEITFIGFYHYSGLPKYTTYGEALIHLKENHKGDLILKNLVPLFYKDDNSEELIHCAKWSENDECEESIQAADLAKTWIEKNKSVSSSSE